MKSANGRLGQGKTVRGRCHSSGYENLIEICAKSCFWELSVAFDHTHILGVNASHAVGFTISSSLLYRLVFCLPDLPV